MKSVKTYYTRLDNWEWDDGHCVVIECDDKEEAERLKELIRSIGMLSHQINTELLKEIDNEQNK